ncbi:hypothetical protein AB0V79_06795 [Mesorhizobium ciceri]|nr:MULTISPECIES: hypothetical protein [Mesorhizobium]MDF3215960.1 hypothetical protein [Mesorhizobium ciceri]
MKLHFPLAKLVTYINRAAKMRLSQRRINHLAVDGKSQAVTEL